MHIVKPPILAVLAPARILTTLYHHHPTPLHGRHLINLTGLGNASVYPALTKLTERGLIHRTEDRIIEGSRSHQYALTGAGVTQAEATALDVARLLRGYDFDPDAPLDHLVQHVPGAGHMVVDGGIVFTSDEVRAHARRLAAAADEADRRNQNH